ncbi:MAG: flagellar hook-length control protein FliK, partial [Phenylobacterium sp.]|nr:flagellar hook-length control protein FliK [Phenylobacterium sp.]
LKPLEAVDKPVHARAADAAAKAASAVVEAAEQPETREARADTDNSDAAVQGETRATTSSSAATGHASHTVRGAPETVANLAAQIIRKLDARTTRFDLELDPQGLGRVDVRVEIGAHGKMTASMVFENPQAAHELKARAAELQRTLEQAGFDLSGGLSFDVADQGRQQGQAWQDQAEGGRAFRGQAFRAALETAGDAVETANLGALRLRRGVNAGVDVRI